MHPLASVEFVEVVVGDLPDGAMDDGRLVSHDRGDSTLADGEVPSTELGDANQLGARAAGEHLGLVHV